MLYVVYGYRYGMCISLVGMFVSGVMSCEIPSYVYPVSLPNQDLALSVPLVTS